jgi:hypothetical protein
MICDVGEDPGSRARLRAAYERAASAHTRAAATEANAAAFYESLGDGEAAARHRAESERHTSAAQADIARAVMVDSGRRERERERGVKSRMMGNHHVRFGGGRRRVPACGRA